MNHLHELPLERAQVADLPLDGRQMRADHFPHPRAHPSATIVERRQETLELMQGQPEDASAPDEEELAHFLRGCTAGIRTGYGRAPEARLLPRRSESSSR